MTATGDSWWGRARWRLYAPVYDVVARPLERGRERAIDRLDLEPGDDVLIVGSGTGLDLRYLPEGVSVTAIDLVGTMVARTAARGEALGLDVDARVGDAHDLAFEDDAFDAVLLHLVLSVVPDPAAAVAETERVLAPDGRVSVYDKFVPDDEAPSLLRRAVNPVARRLFSDVMSKLGPLVADSGLTIEEREWRVGGFYSVATLRPGESA